MKNWQLELQIVRIFHCLRDNSNFICLTFCFVSHNYVDSGQRHSLIPLYALLTSWQSCQLWDYKVPLVLKDILSLPSRYDVTISKYGQTCYRERNVDRWRTSECTRCNWCWRRSRGSWRVCAVSWPRATTPRSRSSWQVRSAECRHCRLSCSACRHIMNKRLVHYLTVHNSSLSTVNKKELRLYQWYR